jgi:VanZ family protein
MIDVNRNRTLRLVLWVVFGIVFSVLPTQQIVHSAKEIFPVLADVQDRISVMVGRPVAYADVQDYLHLPFFVVLGFALIDSLVLVLGGRFLLSIAASFFCVLALSGMLEGIQGMVPGRTACWSDVMVNLKGWVLGVLVYTFIWLSKSQK